MRILFYKGIFITLLVFGFGCLKADFGDEDKNSLKETITIHLTAKLDEGKEWPLEYKAFFSALDSFGIAQAPTKEIKLDTNKTAEVEIDVVPSDVAKVRVEIFNSDQKKIFEGEDEVKLTTEDNKVTLLLHEVTSTSSECSGITILKATPSNTQPTYGEKVTFTVDVENTSTKYKKLYFNLDNDEGTLSVESGEITGDSFSFEWTAPSASESSEKVGEAQIDISIGYNETVKCSTLTKKIGYGETKYIGAKLYVDFINICKEIGDDKSRYTGKDETDFEHEIFIGAPKCADKGLSFDYNDTYGYTTVSISDDPELTVTEFTTHIYVQFGSKFEKEGNTILPQVLFSKGNISLWSYPKVTGDSISKFTLELDLYDSDQKKFPSDEEKLVTNEITRDDTFHLVTVSVANYDKRANIRFYYDGILIKQYTFDRELKLGDSAQDLVIGYAESEYPIDFYGIIDTFALYNYEKTSEEIQEEYQEFISN